MEHLGGLGEAQGGPVRGRGYSTRDGGAVGQRAASFPSMLQSCMRMVELELQATSHLVAIHMPFFGASERAGSGGTGQLDVDVDGHPNESAICAHTRVRPVHSHASE